MVSNQKCQFQTKENNKVIISDKITWAQYDEKENSEKGFNVRTLRHFENATFLFKWVPGFLMGWDFILTGHW